MFSCNAPSNIVKKEGGRTVRLHPRVPRSHSIHKHTQKMDKSAMHKAEVLGERGLSLIDESRGVGILVLFHLHDSAKKVWKNKGKKGNFRSKNSLT